MSINIMSLLLLITILSCNQIQSNPVKPINTDTVIPQETSIINEVNTPAVTILEKIYFNNIIFGGTQKEWNKYAADFAMSDPNIELTEEINEYHIKINGENNQNLYTVEEYPVFKSMAVGTSAGPVKIEGNSSDQFLIKVIRNYTQIYDPAIINTKISSLISQYNLKYKYGYANLHASAPNLDPNDEFFKLYQDFEDKFEKNVNNSTASGSSDKTNSYVGKNKSSHTSQICLFESGDMYISLNVITNSTYTVDKIGGNYSVKNANTSYVLKVELFPKTFAPGDLFEKYASPDEKYKRKNNLKTKELIEKARN